MKPKTSAAIPQPSQNRDNLPAYLFHQGTNYRAEDYLGVHREEGGIFFRVWAPNADALSVVGDFCDWTEGKPMRRITEGGIWEVSFDEGTVSSGQKYKFRILRGGKIFYKADPYAVEAECPPLTASVIRLSETYVWRDAGWLAHREKCSKNFYERPMNIYEIHPGSWKRHEDGSYLTWRELAEDLSPYVKQMGYTHVELMPVMEHPFDGSWGYQICSYFAPTARFGTPDDFRAFVDSMHEAGIGVILDWVPAHFPKDAHGLYEFDGGPLYEYQGVDRQEHKGWGTRCFDVGRNEVECFLVSNALWWLNEYHADGLRVDAVASMLYLDYDRKPGEWIPNPDGGNKNLEAIAFFRKLNSAVKTYAPSCLMIAEESTAFADITTFENGGLGFDMKWNMGWMNDTLSYAVTDPYFRKFNHNKLTFSLTYAFAEKYVLPVSHDEVVHGKKSFLDRMPGDYSQKFAGARTFFTYQMTHPGKKLTFMGAEIGQFREWDFEGSIEWFLLDYPQHSGFQRYVADLNSLYLREKPLYETDGDFLGFRWIDPDNGDDSVYSYCRYDKKGDVLVVLLNMTPIDRESMRFGVPYPGEYRVILNSDETKYGGSGTPMTEKIVSEKIAFRDYEDSAELRMPAHTALILRRVGTVKNIGNG